MVAQARAKPENIIIDLAAGVGAIMVIYAAAVDVAALDRIGCRNLFVVSFALTFVAAIARFFRLRRLGFVVSFTSLGPTHESEQPRLLFWVVCGALLGAYSSREVLLGSFAVGFVGIVASISSMVLLTRALTQNPASG